MTAKEVVLAFWDAMGTNDFKHASQWLSVAFENYMPQTGELIKGRENFVAVNANYPSNIKWLFTLNSITAEGNNVVTDVSITNGTLTARAITFHTVENSLIAKQREYWPDDYPAPEWRSQWVEARPYS